MKRKRAFLIVLSCLLGWFLLVGGCPKATIKLKKIDCNKEDIALNPKVVTRVVNSNTDTYQVEIDFTVTCNGVPVPDAELIIEGWWPGQEKRKTNSQGKTSFRKQVQGNPAGQGHEITAIIEAADGDDRRLIPIP